MDTVAVTWQILDVNDITGDITVKFTNQNNRENTVTYPWSGDKDALVKRLNDDALNYTHIWMCSPISSGIKTELFNMTGTVSSENTLNLDGHLIKNIDADPI